MFLKSKGFLRSTGHWKKHGFETFSGFEKQDNIARWSARNRRATKVIFFKNCAHYGKNAPLRAHREGKSRGSHRIERADRVERIGRTKQTGGNSRGK